MSWRLARSLSVLFAEVNARAPHRSKVSDGTLGDASHQARPSDHNPGPDGIVTAGDFTDDPAGGHNDIEFVEHLRKLGEAGDPRVKYVIGNGRIYGPAHRGWAGRPYTGPNAHAKHTHVSVTDAACDNESPWGWYPVKINEEDAMQEGSTGPEVQDFQEVINMFLIATGSAPTDEAIVVCDGNWGYKTTAAMKHVIGRLRESKFHLLGNYKVMLQRAEANRYSAGIGLLMAATIAEREVTV